MNPNKDIYNKYYTSEQLVLQPTCDYDRAIIGMRQQYVARFGIGKDVLDLCCGSGAYLLPVLDKVKSAVGVDFSTTMLDYLRSSFSGGALPRHLTLLEEDAASLSMANESVDFIFSYTALYYMPKLDMVLDEVARVLRPGGAAVLEIGNAWSLTTLVSAYQHRHQNWAKSYPVPFSRIRPIVEHTGLKIIDWRSFQLLPMFGTPLGLLWLYPLLSPAWKRLMGITLKGKMVDEWLCRCPPLRALAFKHFLLVSKP